MALFHEASSTEPRVVLLHPTAERAASIPPPPPVPQTPAGAPQTNSAAPGRQRELAALEALYEEASREGERLALIVGPRGVGKGRLLQEVRARHRLDGGVLLEGRATPGHAFGPFAGIVDGALRFLREVSIPPSADLADLACSDGCHAFWHQHGEDGAALGARPPDGRLVRHEMNALERRMRFFEAVRGLLADVARVRPPVVVLHDLARADQGSLDLLRVLLDGGEPFTPSSSSVRALFVASLQEGDSRARALAGHPSCRAIVVGSLSLEGVREVLASPDVVARVLSRTGGVLENIETLLESELEAADAMLRRKLLSLSPENRARLAALAVLDASTSFEDLARVSAADLAPSSVAWLDDAVVRGLVVDTGRTVRLRRESDRDRILDTVDKQTRLAMHGRAALLAAQRGDHHRAVVHALAAGEPSRAVDSALLAARSLTARHDHAEAAALLERVVEATQVEDAIGLRIELVEIYRLTGDYRRGIRHAEAVVNVRPDAPDAACALGELLTLAGEHESATALLRRALDLAESEHDAALVSETEARLAELFYQRAEYDPASQSAQRALDAAQRSENVVLELRARNTLGKVALAQRDPAEAFALFEQNRRVAESASLGPQEAQALTNRGITQLVRQELAAARGSFAEASTVATRANDTRERAVAAENLAVLAHLERDFETARTRYHEAVGLLKRLGNRPMLARAAVNLGELYLSLGDVERAQSMVDFALHVGGPSLPVSMSAEAMLLRGRIEAYVGNHALARHHFGDARRAWSEVGAVDRLEANIELLRTELAEGNVIAARDVLATMHVADSPARTAEIAIAGVELERATGNDTLGPARRAVDLATAAGDPVLKLQALTRLARAYLDRGETAQAARIVDQAYAVEEFLESRVPQDCRATFAQRPDRRELSNVEALLHVANGGDRDRARSAGMRSSSVPPPLRRLRNPTWSERYPNLVGSSASIVNVLSLLDKVAPSDCLVLVRGESGTGKELVAEALHNNSPRKDKPIVKVNCAALVETLLLSELFGHERGAFTGAQARKKGRFELADGGTLFLDEIGDISPKTQVALLRVLQEREFERVGGTQPIRVDVRIVAATHRDLEKMVREGTFREDLYYRLRGVTIEMPPLRKRLEDLPAVSARLLKRIADERAEAPKTLAPEALRLLASHRWPGNVRELDNVLRSATLFTDAPQLGTADFAAFAEAFTTEAAQKEPPIADGDEIALAYKRIRNGEHSLFEMKKQLERECIARALAETQGNITRAATLLGMKRPRLSQLVKEYNLGQGEAS